MLVKKIRVALLFFVVVVGLTATFIFSTLLATVPVKANVEENTTIFYDGALGGTPDQQDMEFGKEGFVSQSFSGGVTTLDTTAIFLSAGGYGITPTLMPTLARAKGFRLNFSVQVESEAHVDPNRAGFSVILLAEDMQGIELDFWEDTISAQEGGTTNLFTFAESVSYDTTTGLTDYALDIVNDTYTLSVANTTILTGPVRDYTAWPQGSAPADPYEQPNMVYLGDNSSDGKARIRLSYVAVVTETAVSPLPTSTPTSTPTTSTPTSTPTASTPTSTPAASTPTSTPTPSFKTMLPIIIKE